MARDCENSSAQSETLSVCGVWELDLFYPFLARCIWCGDSPLKLVYPELYRLACSPNAFVGDSLSSEYLHMVGDVIFVRCAGLRISPLFLTRYIQFPLQILLRIGCVSTPIGSEATKSKVFIPFSGSPELKAFLSEMSRRCRCHLG